MLMNEHQLILRMIAQMKRKSERISIGAEELDAAFVGTVVDFIRSYADRCHHGKEEEILFRELAKRDLTAEDAAAMQRLIDDHVWARGKTRDLVEASDRYFGGDTAALGEAGELLGEIADFYPEHIAREDKEFFRRAVTYLDTDERTAMDAECREFDRMLVHERYRGVVEGLEGA
jgi:hemerythrin-like domain-containing protein